MTSKSLFIDLPPELADEAIQLGLGKRRPRRRGSIGDAVTLVIGLGGSLIGLMQAPNTLPEFVRWLIMLTQRDEKLLEIRKRPDGELVITVGNSVDPDVVIETLEKILKDH
jgi:hypothetical protein